MANKKVPRPNTGRKWKERKGSGSIRTWQPGMTAEGRFRGWRPGKYGDLLALETADGLVAFAAPAILADRVRGVELGTLLLIECLGKTKVKAGEAWNFKVMEEAKHEGDDRDDGASTASAADDEQEQFPFEDGQ
jgi:hypothetical protein